MKVANNAGCEMFILCYSIHNYMHFDFCARTFSYHRYTGRKMIADLTIEEISASLDAVVDEILDQCCCQLPPVDAFAIARELGITIAMDDCQTGRARYVRLSNRNALHPKPTILLRSDPRFERQHWAVAHEIGEHTAHRVFQRLGVEQCETSPQAREQTGQSIGGPIAGSIKMVRP